MKVKELESEVIAEITEEKMDRIHDLLREKRLEIDAVKKVLKELETEYNILLEMDVDDFIFPNEQTPNINNIDDINKTLIDGMFFLK